MQQYLDLLSHILWKGVRKGDRTGTGTISVFGTQMRFDLNEGFPLLTTKYVSFHNIKEELLWFLRGETNVRSLQDKNVHIWDQWADENGDLGPVYGHQWRRWGHLKTAFDEERGQWVNTQAYIDQLGEVIERIKTNPNDRRLIVSAWNPGELPNMALPPCHMMFQFYVADGKLSCLMYQRSCDTFIGVPYNIAEYALLTHMVAHVTGLGVGEFVWMGGDTHLYLDHLDQVEIQRRREPLPLTKLWLNPGVKSIDAFTSDDIKILNYQHHAPIKANVSV